MTSVTFFRTTVREPFRRINVPPTHRFGTDNPDPAAEPPGIGDRIDGRGYDCGCRATTDYDRKIGKKIGSDISDTLAKVIPFYAAFRGLQAGLSAFAKTIPGIGPKIAELIDDADPVKALLRFFGGSIDAMLVESLFRNIPAWVPVLRNAPIASKFEEQEVQGILVRSYQRYDGVPYSQWHRWYDWSFVVAPVGPSADMIGAGNRRRTDGAGTEKEEDRLRLDSRRLERHWMPPGAAIDFSIECEWDLGAIDEPVVPGVGQDDQSAHGAFFNPGPLKRDWGWPMAGQYFWCGGRSVYDCRGSTSDDKAVGLHMNQLHPIKALATARFEGFRFKENRAPVPAVQFIFFASNAKPSAGNFKFSTLTEVDYEFVVQLPPGGEGVQSDDPRPIGALPRFTLNTVDIGRRLLVDITSDPFKEGVHTAGGVIVPEVTPIFTVPGRAPTHALVKVPLTKLPSQFDNTGVVVTLGWHDPAGVLAAGVFEVEVAFDAIEVHDAKESGAAEWFVNFGANGRWFQRFLTFDPPASGSFISVPLRNAVVRLFLSRDDEVTVACHGMEEDGEGDEMRLPLDDPNLEQPPPDAPKSRWEEFLKASLKSRQLRLSKTIEIPTGVDKQGNLERERVEMPFVGDPVDWKKHIDPDLPRLRTDDETASEVARALFLRTATYAFDGNDPLGLIDPNIFEPEQKFGRLNDGVDSPNPRKVSDVLKLVGEGKPLACRNTGYATTRIGRMRALALDEDPATFADGTDPSESHPAKVDYILRYRITVVKPGGPFPPPPPVPPPPPPRPTTDPTIRPDSVLVRPAAGPTVVPASVRVLTPPGPSIAPGSVSVTTPPGPTVAPGSVTVTVTKP